MEFILKFKSGHESYNKTNYLSLGVEESDFQMVMDDNVALYDIVEIRCITSSDYQAFQNLTRDNSWWTQSIEEGGSQTFKYVGP